MNRRECIRRKNGLQKVQQQFDYKKNVHFFKGKVLEAYQFCLDLHDPATRERELQGLLEAMQAHNLNSGIILTEGPEEELEVQINEKIAAVSIIPIWKWAGSMLIQ